LNLMSVPTSGPPAYERTLLDLADELSALAGRGAVEVEAGVRALLDNRSERAIAARLREVRAAALEVLVDRMETAYAVAKMLGISETSLSDARRPRRRVSSPTS